MCFHNRKGWLFSDTVKGAVASANPLFACRSAKANGVEPHAYLSLMLDKLPNAKSAEDFEALLPWNLKFGLTAGSQSPSPSRESME
jgi:transposase